MVKKYFELKDEVSEKDLLEMTPWALILFSNFVLYCEQRGLPVKITSIKNDGANIKRVSKSHSQGRALDISVVGWTETQIKKAVSYFNNRFKHIGAISFSDGQSRAIVYHDSGYGAHFHLQVRPMDEKIFIDKKKGLLAKTLEKFPHILKEKIKCKCF